MSKILVVDDENIIRRGLVKTIPWRSFGIDTVLEARNGAEALEIFKTGHPDILLTDIRMPVMDGISLTREVRKINDEVKILYLTGYSDIEYVRAAFENKAADYILKPVDYDELLLVLNKTVRQINDHDTLKNLRSYLESKLILSAPIYIRRLLADLVETRFTNISDLADKLRFWGTAPESDNSYLALVVAIEGVAKLSSAERQLLSFGTESILQELLDNGPGGNAVHLRDNRFICIVPEQGVDNENVNEFSTQLISVLSNHLNRKVILSVGPPVQGLFNLYESYQCAENILRNRSHNDTKLVYYYKDTEVLPAESFEVNKESIEKICGLLKDGRQENFNTSVKKIIANILNDNHSGTEHTRGFFLFVAGYVVNYVTPQIIGREFADAHTNCAGKLYLCETEDDMTEIILGFLGQIRKLLAQNRIDSSAGVVAEIKIFLEDNLSGKSTINDVAGHVYLTTPYVCSLFKQHTGMTINEFLTRRRIETAKKLLISGNYKIYEVAPMVGYQDVKYFGRIFKRYTGVAPSDFCGTV